MGKWNRRWVHRKIFYQEPVEPSMLHYDIEPESSGGWQNSVPSWEKQFCSVVGLLPWKKVLVAKQYMHCYDDVVKWKDSAGEEAFHNAKERFRAAINGLPCDIPMPDPDMYIDKINWNPHIDAELISDLDRAYFNPDEGERYKKAETANQTAQNSVFGPGVGWNTNLSNGDNPWEGSDQKGTGALEHVTKGWNQWDGSALESRNINNAENPWEHSYTQVNGAQKDTAWGSTGAKPWGWNQGQASDEQSNNYYPLEHGCQNGGPMKEKGWGSSGNNSWGWDTSQANMYESRIFRSADNPWAQTPSFGNGHGNDRGWGECGHKNWGWKQQLGIQNYEPKHLDSRRVGGALGATNSGFRKREGSHRYSSRYKSSRFQGGDYDTGRHWREGTSQNRASFT